MIKLVSATTRVTIGLLCMTASIWLLAYSIGLFPDSQPPVSDGRNALCENVAFNCSLLASRNDQQTIQRALTGLVARNKSVLSAAIRLPDDAILASAGPHAQAWTNRTASKAPSNQVQTPILSGEHRLGTLEVKFRGDVASQSWLSSIPPMWTLALFITSATYLMYYFYLRKMMKHLAPAKVIPKRVRQTLDTLADGLLVLDNNECISMANESFAQIIGVSPTELIGRNANNLPWQFTDPQLREDGFPWQRELFEGRSAVDSFISMMDPNGNRRTFKVNAMPVCGEDGSRRGTMVSFDDVTEMESNREHMREMLQKLSQSRDEIHQHNVELERLASHDPLTDCLNRRSFFSQAENYWSLAERHEKPLSCIMIDLDHFKVINDMHGHQVGDAVLVETANLLRQGRRQEDLVGRFGGEEFCVFLPHSDIDYAFVTAEKLRVLIESYDFDGLSVTASIGVSARGLEATDPQGMIDQADKSLYVAKREGRNRVIRYDEAVDKIAAAEADPAIKSRDLGRSLASDGMEPTVPFHAVTALVSALSFRDPSTADHSRRVADLCVETARRLMPSSESYNLEIAALLHDIGKIGVPDSILLKPGKLTDEEWQTMNSHERMGAEIVQSTFSSSRLTETIRTYRAWYGGKPGQPELPRGDSIPLAARILAIADAYDSMTSRKTFRTALSQDEAFQELRRCAGRQFDPALTERFIEVIESQNLNESNFDIDASKAAAMNIGSQIERLSDALDNQDRNGIAVLAQRLVVTAQKYDATQIADVAAELQQAASDDSDIAELVLLTSELIDLCRLVQRAYLDTTVRPKASIELGLANNGDDFATHS